MCSHGTWHGDIQLGWKMRMMTIYTSGRERSLESRLFWIYCTVLVSVEYNHPNCHPATRIRVLLPYFYGQMDFSKASGSVSAFLGFSELVINMIFILLVSVKKKSSFEHHSLGWSILAMIYQSYLQVPHTSHTSYLSGTSYPLLSSPSATQEWGWDLFCNLGFTAKLW